MTKNILTLSIGLYKYWIALNMELCNDKRHIFIGKTDMWNWQCHICLFNIQIGLCLKVM